MTDFKKIFHLMESIDPTYRNYLLNEDKRTDQAKARCMQVIRNHFNNASWLDTTFNHQDNPQGLSYIDYMFKQFMEEFYHDPNYRKRAVMRLAPLFCKLAFEANFQNNNPDTDKLNRLSSILHLIYNMDAQGKNISSKIDIDNTSFDDLNNQFGTIIDDLNNQEEERIKNTVYELNSEYEVIGPVDYETAHEYGEKSCSTSKLCYTQSESTWNNYSKNGLNNAYIILKKGWENIPEQHDDASESAYDTYGLSMIFVFVDGKGGLAYCNTRWNHRAKYAPDFSCDHAMNKKQISELIGARFNDVFKPNNKLAELCADIQRRLDNGESPRDVFDNVWDFKEGYARVYIRDAGYNFITTENKILRLDILFDNAGNFREGLAKVSIEDKGWNYIKTDSKYLRDDLWFDKTYDFKEGYGIVWIRNKGYNFINKDGKILRDDLWFYDVYNFREGYAPVYINYRGWNYINTKGGYLCPDIWFDEAWEFREGYARVYINHDFYNIDTNGILYDYYNGNRVDIPVQESKKYKINWLI